MIIVEGLDNTGKTTLVSQTIEDFPELIYRPSIGNKHDLNQIRSQAWEEAFYNRKLNLTISDRSRIISEYVYNPVIRGRPLAFAYIDFMGYLANFTMGHHLVVYCYRHMSKIIDQWHDRDQLEGVRANLTTLSARYDEFMAMLRFLFAIQNPPSSNVLTYNFEDTAYSYVQNAVRSYLEEGPK